MDFSLLHQLCEINATSGNEKGIRDFILDFVENNASKWKVRPQVLSGEGFQDCIMLVFGTPRTAVFTHMDSVGFTAAYQNEVVRIGSPAVKSGTRVVGKDAFGTISCELEVNDEGAITHNFPRGIARGTELVFACDFRETDDFIQTCYLDNRAGIFSALKLAETLENGVLVFSCWEEIGGGSVPYLAKYLYEDLQVRQALIADITWVTSGVTHGEGVTISLRDHNIPRKSYLQKILHIAEQSGIAYQLEVESSGSSDGRELQQSPYPIDWCFIGAPEDNVHSPDEIIHKGDLEAMIKLYQVLLKEL